MLGILKTNLNVVNEITKDLIGSRRRKAINVMSEESKTQCKKRRSLRIKVINSKKSLAATIQEYRQVNRIVKKKRFKKLKEDNWMKKYGKFKMILERTIHKICSNRYVN